MAFKTQPILCDTHAHLDFKPFKGDFDQVLVRARRAGVEFIITIGAGSGFQSVRDAVRIANDHDWIWTTVGWHPHEASQLDGEQFMQLRRVASEEPKVKAIGEIGLDFHYDRSPRNVQKEVFRQLIYLARELHKPLVIHTREAEVDTIDIMKSEGAREVGGVVHCFSGSDWLARQALDLGFYISFSGMLTFPNANNIREVARWAPIDRILVETDAPFLSPTPLRQQRNEPAHVQYTLRTLAKVRNENLLELAEAVYENGRQAFSID